MTSDLTLGHEAAIGLQEALPKAVIYTRVSNKKQLKGSGLKSQEHRCRQYAATKGYLV